MSLWKQMSFGSYRLRPKWSSCTEHLKIVSSETQCFEIQASGCNKMYAWCAGGAHTENRWAMCIHECVTLSCTLSLKWSMTWMLYTSKILNLSMFANLQLSMSTNHVALFEHPVRNMLLPEYYLICCWNHQLAQAICCLIIRCITKKWLYL